MRVSHATRFPQDGIQDALLQQDVTMIRQASLKRCCARFRHSDMQDRFHDPYNQMAALRLFGRELAQPISSWNTALSGAARVHIDEMTVTP